MQFPATEEGNLYWMNRETYYSESSYGVHPNLVGLDTEEHGLLLRGVGLYFHVIFV